MVGMTCSVERISWLRAEFLRVPPSGSQSHLPWHDSKKDQVTHSPQPSFDWRDVQSNASAHLN